MRRKDSRLAVGAIKPLQPGVPEAPNHVSIVSIRYTKVNTIMQADSTGPHKLVEYTICVHGKYEELARDAVKHFFDGWQPLGGISVAQNESGDTCVQPW